MEPTEANLTALERTIRKYEQAIQDIESGASTVAEVKRWWKRTPRCLLCASVEPDGEETPCAECVLYLKSTSSYCNSGVMRQSIAQREFALSCEAKPETLLPALKDRLAAILKRVGRRGYELVQIGRKKQ